MKFLFKITAADHAAAAKISSALNDIGIKYEEEVVGGSTTGRKKAQYVRLEPKDVKKIEDLWARTENNSLTCLAFQKKYNLSVGPETLRRIKHGQHASQINGAF